ALALAGHQMTARWHLGPIEGFSFWWVLVTSPEVLVFLFFMITDPKTAPRGPRARVVYALVLGALASALIAPTRTEFAAKVALLSSLAIVCLAKALLELAPIRVTRTRIAAATAVGLAVWAGAVLFGSSTAPSLAAQAAAGGSLPEIRILHSPGVQTQLTEPTARLIAQAVVAAEPSAAHTTLAIHLVPGTDQSPPTAVAQAGSATYHLNSEADGSWSLAGAKPHATLVAEPTSSKLAGTKLTDVAASVGLDFRQGSFRYGISNDYRAMMGGGVCWLDYNGDGFEDLFAVNSYASADTARWQAQGGLPTTELFENDHGQFVNVTAKAHAGLPVQGDGCVAADLNGDGRTDLVVTTTTGIDLLWNNGNGNGTFTEGAQAAGMTATGWYTGVAVADVNGDGRPDVFVAGYSDPNDPVANSLAGFPTNLTGVRDLLYLNEGDGRFREVGVQAGLESSDFSHGLGAQFLDVNGDGRPDLYVANDEDPNELYVNVPWPGGAAADPAGLGFRFEQRSLAEGVADPYAGMGIASATKPSGLLDLFVSNSRGEPSAAYAERAGSGSPAFANARGLYDPALGTSFAGWGDSWVDVANSGTPDLVLAAGAIPVTNLAKDAEAIRVLAPAKDGGYGNANGIVVPSGLTRNGRGVAAADVDNDGRVDVAINSIGGKLVLLQPSGASGHWLDVQTATFAPGAVVTVTLPSGHRLVGQVQAGSSYLSSEDPRVHFGLGTATRVTSVSVRYPWDGGTRTVGPLAADRIVTVPGPAAQPSRSTASSASYALRGCAAATRGGSIATVWQRTALAVLRAGGASEPVQARDLYDL
ncbi:MAG TPA: FG-GAP-like repeat-containing protein, partial [Gaiellaceae bacterium]|nr:FG-GAP-like repeat-containing protein [Gaiellaceae bacterium]